MASSPSYWSSEAATARAQQFGRFLLVWRNQCDWSQHDLPQWGDEAGFVTPAYGTASQLEQGKVKSPTMALFAGLAEANRRIWEKDWSGIVSRRIRDRIPRGVPVLDDDGNPWGFHQFVTAFHLPDQASGPIWRTAIGAHPAPLLDDAEVARVNAALVAAFAALVERHGTHSKALAAAIRPAPTAQRPALEAACFQGGYPREQLTHLWGATENDWLPLVWLREAQGKEVVTE